MTRSTTLKNWFDGLQPREQRILRFGIPIIAAILILGAVGWLLDAREAATQRWQRAAALEPRLPLLLSSGTQMATPPSTTLAQARTEGALTILPIVDTPFEQVLDQIAEWERRGGDIQAIQLTRTTEGRVSGEIRGSIAPR